MIYLLLLRQYDVANSVHTLQRQASRQWQAQYPPRNLPRDGQMICREALPIAIEIAGQREEIFAAVDVMALQFLVDVIPALR